MDASKARNANANTDDMQQMAAKLEAENPLWLVVFGVYTRQFIAFPRFPVPPQTFLAVHYPPALPDRMREVEARSSVARP
jgi:hypothetical protein